MLCHPFHGSYVGWVSGDRMSIIVPVQWIPSNRESGAR
jgi:hypothetical protein